MSGLLIHGLDVDSRILIGVAGVLILITIFALSRRAEKLVDIPVMTGYGSNHEKALTQGTLKYPTTPFVVETQRPFVIVPKCCWEELKNLPQTQLTFWEVQKKEMLGDFTGIFQHNAALNLALRSDMNRDLAGALTQVEDKINWVLEKEVGNFDGWKSFRVHRFVILIVARLVAGIFIGSRFTKDDEWINLSLGLATDLVLARDAIKKWPVFMQPVVGPFVPEIRTVNRQITRMAKKLKPVIFDSVLETTATGQRLDDEEIDLKMRHGEAEGSFMSWILKRLDTADPEILARAQISLSFASINTTTNALCFMVLDLAARPEYIHPLREEIDEVIAQDTVLEDADGVLRFTQSSLAKLWKLDSFMKESLRFSRAPITCQRMVMDPITLSTGHRLPKGTRIAFDAGSVHMSPQTETFSPEYNPTENKPPNEFDGFRFCRLRKMTGKEHKHEFITVSADSMTWGYGNHACPGRFFADAEIKIILIELLRRWDFRVADPVKTNPRSLRKTHELSSVAPRHAEIELRRRET